MASVFGQVQTTSVIGSFSMFVLLLCGVVPIFTVVVAAPHPYIESVTSLAGQNFPIGFHLFTGEDSSKLHHHDYHIARVSIPTQEEPLMMHLTKSDFISLIDPDLHTEVTELQCTFSGKLSNSSGSAVGVASLSSCHHENAFEGILLVDDNHFYVSPALNKSHNTGSVSKTHTKRVRSNPVSYEAKLLTRPVDFARPISNDGSLLENKNRRDTLAVPSDRLRDARRDMWRDQDALQDEDEENDDDVQNSNSVEHKGTVYTAKMQGVANRNVKTKNNVVKRPAKVIELAIFTDEAFYKKWAKQFPAQTDTKIKQYILTLVNNMNYMYKQPSLQNKLSFRLVHIAIQRNTPSGLRPVTNAEKYLDSFCKFQGKKDTNGALWDHGMMITGLDIRDPSLNPSTIGLAYTSAMCLRYYSCSLVEFTKGFETAFTATHEIGHSLGMDHDGEDINRNCNPAKFIMAALADRGQINWSKCSAANLRNFLRSGDPRPSKSDPQSLPRCLTKRGLRKQQINYSSRILAGRKVTAQNQCQIACAGCTPMINNKAPFNNICFMLYCHSKKRNKSIGVHPALEGTSCGGNGKRFCRNGKCIT